MWRLIDSCIKNKSKIGSTSSHPGKIKIGYWFTSLSTTPVRLVESYFSWRVLCWREWELILTRISAIGSYCTETCLRRINSYASSCVQVIWAPGSEGSAAIWAEILNKIKEGLVSAFDCAISQREDEVKRSEGQRQMPGWNFCTFFILKVTFTPWFIFIWNNLGIGKSIKLVRGNESIRRSLIALWRIRRNVCTSPKGEKSFMVRKSYCTSSNGRHFSVAFVYE